MFKAFLGFGIVGAFASSSIGGTLLIITVFLAAVFSEPVICLIGFLAAGVIPRMIMWYAEFRLEPMKKADRPMSVTSAGVLAVSTVLVGAAGTIWFASVYATDYTNTVVASLFTLCIAGNTLLSFMDG